MVEDKKMVRVGSGADILVGAAFVDTNLDGLFDLWISNIMQLGNSSLLPDRLFIGSGDGLFTDGTADLGEGAKLWIR